MSENKHMSPKPILIDREVMIGLMREERPDLSEATLKTNYGDVGRFLESVLLTMTPDELEAALELAGFAPSGFAALDLVRAIAKKRRSDE